MSKAKEAAAQKAAEAELEARADVAQKTEAAESGADPAKDVETQETAETAEPRQILFVTAPAKGFRRAGRFWPGGVTEVSADEFTAEQLEQLRSEPRLTVIEAEA